MSTLGIQFPIPADVNIESNMLGVLNTLFLLYVCCSILLHMHMQASSFLHACITSHIWHVCEYCCCHKCFLKLAKLTIIKGIYLHSYSIVVRIMHAYIYT